MLQFVLDLLFGCPHRRTTFPITPRKGVGVLGVSRFGTYVVCLECGKELAYDWQEMRIVTSPDEYSGGVRSLATKEAA